MYQHRIDLNGDHPRSPAQKMRSQCSSSRPDFHHGIGLLGTRNLSDAFQYAWAREEMLPEAATQLSFYFNVAGIVEGNSYRTGDRFAKRGGRPEFGEQQAILNAVAKLLGLTGRAN